MTASWRALIAIVALACAMLALTTYAWSANDTRTTDYTTTLRTQTDQRMLFVRLDCWTACPPCRKVEGELRSINVDLKVIPTDTQHVREYPTAHYVTASGVPVQESGLDNITKRLRAGGLRFTGTAAKPTLEVRMWSGK